MLLLLLQLASQDAGLIRESLHKSAMSMASLDRFHAHCRAMSDAQTLRREHMDCRFTASLGCGG